VRETARPLSPAGALATMSWSPVHAGDAFTVDVYAGHTGGYPLSTWGVLVDIRTDALSYVGHTNPNTFFNGTSVFTDRLNDTHTRLTFIAVGIRSATTNAQVTAAAVPLLRLRLRAAAGLGVGRHDGLLSLIAQQFVNTGGAEVAKNDAGVVLDPTTGLAGAAQGSLEVVLPPPPPPHPPPLPPPLPPPPPPPPFWWWLPPPTPPPPPSTPTPLYSAAQLATVREAARPHAPAGVLVTMPTSPVYAGVAFTVDVYAYTGGFALESWSLEFNWRTDELSYVSHVVSSAFIDNNVIDTGYYSLYQ